MGFSPLKFCAKVSVENRKTPMGAFRLNEKKHYLSTIISIRLKQLGVVDNSSLEL